eukprot:gb/GECH01011794.1/.p1 GENE.gb/GECH01011794.1/~~gb/GECH01011794.1/.p1  ORF type:complete len:177 (+),score=41.70 gb/GECH01011794.1/:1-531(+)
MLRISTHSVSARPSTLSQRQSSSFSSYGSRGINNKSTFSNVQNSSLTYSRTNTSKRCYSSNESSYIFEGTTDDLNNLKKNPTKPTIVDFYADWCGPCKVLGPQLERYVTSANGKVQMMKVNVEEDENAADVFNITALPTIIAFHQGHEVDKWVGMKPEADIKALVEKLEAMADEKK